MQGNKQVYGDLTMVCRPDRKGKLTKVTIYKLHENLVDQFLSIQYQVISHKFKKH